MRALIPVALAVFAGCHALEAPTYTENKRIYDREVRAEMSALYESFDDLDRRFLFEDDMPPDRYWALSGKLDQIEARYARLFMMNPAAQSVDEVRLKNDVKQLKKEVQQAILMYSKSPQTD